LPGVGSHSIGWAGEVVLEGGLLGLLFGQFGRRAFMLLTSTS
jgi:hypothetical protein